MSEEYKMTDLGEIPVKWKVEELSDFAKCTVGIASSATHAYTQKGVLLIRNQNIKEGKIDLSDVLYVTEEYEQLHKTKRLKAGDILTVRTGYPGVSAVVPKGLEGSQSFTTLIIRDIHKSVNSYFLCYYINSEKGKQFFSNNQAGGGQQNVGAKVLEKLKLPIPPLNEQQKIVDILSTVDEKIEVIVGQINQTIELKKGLMQQLLTRGIGHTQFKASPLGEIPESWEVAKLGQLVDSFAGGTPLRTNTKYYENGTIPWVKSGEVNQNHIIQTEEKITEMAIVESSAKMIEANSLLVALYGATAGNVGMLRIKAASNQAVLAVNSKSSDLINEYIYYYLKLATPKLLSLTQGSGQPNLSKGLIDGLSIPVPPVNEQNKIVNILSTVDNKLDALQKKKFNFHDLKKGLMQQLLTGKLSVKHLIENEIFV